MKPTKPTAHGALHQSRHRVHHLGKMTYSTTIIDCFYFGSILLLRLVGLETLSRQPRVTRDLALGFPMIALSYPPTQISILCRAHRAAPYGLVRCSRTGLGYLRYHLWCETAQRLHTDTTGTHTHAHAHTSITLLMSSILHLRSPESSSPGGAATTLPSPNRSPSVDDTNLRHWELCPLRLAQQLHIPLHQHRYLVHHIIISLPRWLPLVTMQAAPHN